MDISIVVALSDNHVIGRNNTLPWRLPEDLKHFKRTTMGYPVVMGRKTFESIGKPLPGRLNIVVTRQRDWRADGAQRVNSIDEAFRLGAQNAQSKSLDQVMLIGGADLYAQSLARCTRLYLTEVHAQIDGDAFFPHINRSQWTELSREHHAADEKNPHDYSFVMLQRKT